MGKSTTIQRITLEKMFHFFLILLKVIILYDYFLFDTPKNSHLSHVLLCSSCLSYQQLMLFQIRRTDAELILKTLREIRRSGETYLISYLRYSLPG